ncbi:MAG: hypothetical protein ACR2P8_03385 [Myxococcota bacterium]
METWKKARLGVGAAILIAGLMLPAHAQAMAGPDARQVAAETSAKAFDVVILRPLGFVGTLIGSALFVPVAVITSPGGRDPIEEALELFVLTPGKFVFTRPLGSF